jgi:uridine kinase
MLNESLEEMGLDPNDAQRVRSSSVAQRANNEKEESKPSNSNLPTSPSKSSVPAPKSIKWTVGRAPWYDDTGKRQAPFIIGITGGSASGKTSVCKQIVNQLGLPWVVMLSMDRFYRPLTKEERADVSNYNFDHPSAFDYDGLVNSITSIKSGSAVKVPRYNFTTHSREEQTDVVYGCDVVLVEGILVLYDKRVRDLLDMKIFVNTDSDYRLIRRIKRDIVERGRTVESVLDQYEKTVKPSFEDFIAPCMKHADIVIPWNDTNTVAVDLLSEHIRSKLQSRGLKYQKIQRQRYLQKSLSKAPSSSTSTLSSSSSDGDSASSSGKSSSSSSSSPLLFPNQVPPQVHVMERTKQLIALHTIIRDKTTEMEDFRFNISRLVVSLVAEALNFIDFRPVQATTCLNTQFFGVEPSLEVVGVSIVRSGECFESALLQVLPEANIGKIVLKQAVSHKKEMGPRLYYAKLPPLIESKKILLMDGVLATGAAVIMAIRVLLDHGVDEGNIIFCCLISAPDGVHDVIANYPKVKIVSSWMDDGLDEQGFVTPGLGYLGDRFFGTGKQNH